MFPTAAGQPVPPHVATDAGAGTSERLNRPGGDVEVAVSRAGGRLTLRGTWRRVGLRALWAVPRLAIAGAALGVLWWQVPGSWPSVVAVGVLVAVHHLMRGLREVRGAVRGWLTIDGEGVRGPAIGSALSWSQVDEIRLYGDARTPTIAYVSASAAVQPRARAPWSPARRGGSRVAPDVLPTEALLEMLVPGDVPLALGDPDHDPLDVEVADEGFHVRPARGRPLSMRWESVLAVEVTSWPAGDARLARSVEVLGEVRLPGAVRTREELISLPVTVAGRCGLLDALRRFDATIPERAASSAPGTHELWSR